MKVSVVIPTLGRPSLSALLARIDDPSLEVVVVDDRPSAASPLPVPDGVRVVRGRSRGPAAARNTGWQAATHEWVAFLDDDVLPSPAWPAELLADLDAAPDRVGGVQGTLQVPLPAGRRPTDWERVTAGLAEGAWITADMAYRRAALTRAGGFDERLPRAFREDAELAFRVRQAGWTLIRGRRVTVHPVRPESPWVSVRTQRGNADDALLRRLYGPRWRPMLEIPPGRRRRHAAVTAAGAGAVVCALVALARRDRRGRRDQRDRRDRRGSRSTPTPFWAGHSKAPRSDNFSPLSTAAWALAAGWALGTAEFAAARILPGPRHPREIATMVATSVAIPPVAVGHWLRGWWHWRNARPVTVGRSGEGSPADEGYDRPASSPVEVAGSRSAEAASSRSAEVTA